MWRLRSDGGFNYLSGFFKSFLILKLSDLLSTASRQRPLSCWKRTVQAHFHSIMNHGVIVYQQPLLGGPLNSHHCICTMQLIGFPCLGNIITICAYLSVKPLLLNSDLKSPGCSGGGGVIGWCCRRAETRTGGENTAFPVQLIICSFRNHSLSACPALPVESIQARIQTLCF